MSPMLAVVVLAGGQGRRIGGGKPERRLGGVTLLGRAWGRAGDWSRLRAIAGGAGGPEGARVLTDPPGLEGPLGGLAAALAFAAAPGAARVLTLACDTPFLPDDLPHRLSAALDCGAQAAVPTSAGRRHFACALWRADLGPALEAYAATGRRSLAGFVDGLVHVSVAWPDQPLDPFVNINTPEDLAAAEARLRARP